MGGRRAHALTLAEAANLLLTPGRSMSRPEEANSKSQPDAPELTPTQIEKKIADNRAEWVTHAKELQATAVKAMAAAKAHDKDGLLNVGEAIDGACRAAAMSCTGIPTRRQPVEDGVVLSGLY